MKSYKSIISFCLLLIAIRSGSGEYTPLDEKAVCVNSKLIQFNNYFECVCEKGKVHETDLKCEEPIKTECTGEDTICGDYAKCESDGQLEPKYECKCIEGYEFNEAQPPVCVPIGCKAIGNTCGNGICVKKNDSSANCACLLGFKADGSGKCTESTEINQECRLTCKGDNVTCIITESKHYDCGCLEGYVFNGEHCEKIVEKEEYEPLHEKSKCKNSTLIQYTDYFVCSCDEGLVHSDIDVCDKSSDGKCKKAGELCGDFAVCVKDDGDKEELECKCKKGYEYNYDKKPICVPVGCAGAAKNGCGKGFCSKLSDKIAQCTCFVGNEYDEVSGTCISSKKENKCKLTCTGNNVDCVIADGEYYKCDCKEGFQLIDGKCAEGVKGSAFPANGIFNVGLLFLISSIVFVLI